MVSLKPEEISKLIKEQIRRYDDELEVGETGTVITIGDGISLVHGLNNAMSGELLLFPHDVYGMVLNLEEEHVGAVLLGDDEGIKEGDEVKRTGKIDHNIIVLFQFSFLFFDRNARPVSYKLVGTGQCVEQGCFTTVRVTRKGNSQIHMSFLTFLISNR